MQSQERAAAESVVKDGIAACEITPEVLDAALALVDHNAELFWPVFSLLGSVSDLMVHLDKTRLDDATLHRYLQLDGEYEDRMRERILANPNEAVGWLGGELCGEPLAEPSRLVELFTELLSRTVQVAAPRGRAGAVLKRNSAQIRRQRGWFALAIRLSMVLDLLHLSFLPSLTLQILESFIP